MPAPVFAGSREGIPVNLEQSVQSTVLEPPRMIGHDRMTGADESSWGRHEGGRILLRTA